MNDLAMGIEPNYDMYSDEQAKLIRESIDSVKVLEGMSVFYKNFTAMYESPQFKLVVLDTLLGSEMEGLATSLVTEDISDEKEAEILTILRSLRYLNTFFESKKLGALHIEGRLEEDRKLLQARLAETEDD